LSVTQIILSSEGLEKFKSEREQLERKVIPAVENRLRELIEDGFELGEYDYDDAKAELEFYESRQVYLHACIHGAKWNDEKKFYEINLTGGDKA